MSVSTVLGSPQSHRDQGLWFSAFTSHLLQCAEQARSTMSCMARPLQAKCWKRRHAPSGHSICSRQKAWLALPVQTALPCVGTLCFVTAALCTFAPFKIYYMLLTGTSFAHQEPCPPLCIVNTQLLCPQGFQQTSLPSSQKPDT